MANRGKREISQSASSSDSKKLKQPSISTFFSRTTAPQATSNASALDDSDILHRRLVGTEDILSGLRSNIVPDSKSIIDSLVDYPSYNGHRVKDALKDLRVLVKRDVTNSSSVTSSIHESILSLQSLPKIDGRNYQPSIRNQTVGRRSVWLLTCKLPDARPHDFLYFDKIVHSDFTRAQAQQICAFLTDVANRILDVNELTVPSTQYNFMIAKRSLAMELLKAATRVANPNYALRIKIPSYAVPQASVAKGGTNNKSLHGPAPGIKIRTNIVNPDTLGIEDWSTVIRTSTLTAVTDIPDITTNVLFMKGNTAQPKVAPGPGLPAEFQSCIPDDLDFDDVTMDRLRAAEKLGRIIVVHMSGKVISKKDANELVKTLVESYGGTRGINHRF